MAALGQHRLNPRGEGPPTSPSRPQGRPKLSPHASSLPFLNLRGSSVVLFVVHKPLSHQLFHFVPTDWSVQIVIAPFHQCQDWNLSSGFPNNSQAITFCSTYSRFGRIHTDTHRGICMQFALETIQMCICPQYTFVGSLRKSSYNSLGKHGSYLGILAKWLSSVSLSVHTRMYTHTHTQCLAHVYLYLYINHHT